ncbi:MAG: nucleoside triphosphate pyrophosphohydrolase [Woeseiaceae bacterium]|nr:nucleoside triphosphate pyrophosphohydrolase [Woeseiaceae bacterium]
MRQLEKLVEIMAHLRDKETGCPWDVEQDFSTIAPYTIEEAYEVADAIARNDLGDLRDELGDLLFQVVFHARIAEELGEFTFDDVASGITDKMVRRHPHVFGTDAEKEAGPQKGAWEQIKAAERAAAARSTSDSLLDGIAVAMPALKRAEKLGKRAASVGFDWPDARGARAKIGEELSELSAAECSGKRQDMEEEFGDLLFAVVNLARHLKIDPEKALSDGNRKFERRFRRMESAAADDNISLETLRTEELEARWQEAKKEL